MGGQFSRRTVIAAVDVIESVSSQAKLSSFLIELGQDVYSQVRDERAASATKRMNDLKKFVDANPTCQVTGGVLETVIVEKAASFLPSEESEYAWRQPIAPTPAMEKFKRALEQDGFSVRDGKLLRTLPAKMELPQAEDEIFRLLEKHGFRLAKGHLDQAFANHADGNWAAANSQIRSFLDGLLDEIAARIDLSAATLASGQPRRTRLAAAGFLSRELNEWDDNGLGFVNGLVKRLHPHGAHPGLSDQDDSTFRLHIVLLTARLFLGRFDTWGKP